MLPKPLIFFVTAFAFLGLSNSAFGNNAIPQVQDGVLDLQGADLQSINYLSLGGDWDFYPNQLLSPDQLDEVASPTVLTVPQPWHTLTESMKREGMGTYHLVIQLDSSHLNAPLTLKLRTIYVAYRCFLNGQEVVSHGNLSKEDFAPQVFPESIHFTPTQTKQDLVIQVGNHRFFKGGMVENPLLGTAANMQKVTERNIAIEVVLVGSILMVAIYHFIIFLLIPSNRSTFYFSILCFVLALRFAATGEHYLTQFFTESMGWVSLRMEYGTLYIGPILIPLFFRSLYPKEVPRWMIFGFLAMTIPLAFSLLIPNSFYYSILLPLGQLNMLLMGAVTMLYVLPVALWRRRKAAKLFTLAFVFLFTTAVNDFFYAINVVETGFLIHYGMLGFIFVQAVALALRFGFTFQQLNLLRKNLESKVEQRSAELILHNQELEQQKEELTAQTEQLTANLEFARRIQKASLNSEGYLQSLFSEAFVLYFPRDYVSGDFYWFGEVEGKKVVIGGDCTGHGVPGAFMTALGQAALDQIILGEKQSHPGTILQQLEEQVRSTLQSQVDGKWLPDGMDVGVMVFDEQAGMMAFSGAKIDLVYIRGKEIVRVRGSKFPIGRATGYGVKTFDTHEIEYQPGDRYYVFSDGYRDQFGGPEGRKFNAKPFRSLLEQTAGGTLADQHRDLSHTFEEWKGHHPQTDDILVLGLEV